MSDEDQPTHGERRRWSEYWATDGAAGEVFVHAGGQAHPEVSKWWRDAFALLPADARIVDLACGAGSVFAHLPEGHGHALCGADISAQALALLCERIPAVTTTVCSAAALPYADGEFGAAVSQFGIEYAGPAAFAEAARIVAPGGHLMVLCHIVDGYIDARNRAHLAGARPIVASGFIDKAQALIEAAFATDAARVAAAAAAFVPAERALAAECQALGEGVHAHLYAGFRQLYEKRADYHLHDMVAWLDDMRQDVALSIDRLDHMCRAARSEEDMAAVQDMLATTGYAQIACRPFQISNHDRPLAWSLIASRP